jgi:hypothetical protein
MSAALFHSLGASLLALLLLTWGGNLACKLLLRWSGLSAARIAAGADPPPVETTAPAKEPRVGRVIGDLERLTIAAGLLLGAWEVLVAVVALKSVARVQGPGREAERRIFPGRLPVQRPVGGGRDLRLARL